MDLNGSNTFLREALDKKKLSLSQAIDRHRYDSLIKQACFDSVIKRNELYESELFNCYNMTKEAMMIKNAIYRKIEY